MEKNDITVQSQAASLRNLEMQMGQLATDLKSRPNRALSSDIKVPKRDEKEQCYALTLRSGKTLPTARPNAPRIHKELNQDEGRGLQTEACESDGTPIIMPLHVNIPLVEALEQMPTYVRFLKDILTKKRKLREYETVTMTKACSNILTSKILEKTKDLGSFTIPVSIGGQKIGQALYDLGASINLMPLSIYKKLWTGEAQLTTVTLQLAD
ncbi:uncharacterized protein LOC111019599 [Momordica charantia]|uniref:Uncharacterized protein LOC111019599 n=1 Tax=Momordica charantia TaxID=3673 RepID=A0A6J1DDS7_MOMCH|nr:uncharacterized protein LOC111019599 [Momordica charantia]